MISVVYLFIGICLYTVFHSLRKAINDGMVPPISYPLLWAIIIVGFATLFLYCSCT